MTQPTIQKYKEILLKVKESKKNLKTYCTENGLNYKSIVNAISSLRKKNEAEELINLYNEITSKGEVDSDNKTKLSYIRDENNKIISYQIEVYRRDTIPFKANISREEAETIFGLYTYYGGNVTARNVANEFPKYTLPEIKRILRAFQLTKDSIWAPPHLLEEMSKEELANYRMSLKEKAAFKYADARQERDFKNIINKLADKINKLEDRQNLLSDLCQSGINIEDINKPVDNTDLKRTLIIYLSDLHVGAYNEKQGYIRLEDYDEKEIGRRLSKIFNLFKSSKYERIVVFNLGDNLDSYNKQTTRGGHDLPSIVSNKEQSQMYLRIMLWFFTNLKQYCKDISYYGVGESNHSGDWGWINDIALGYKLKELNIKAHVSDAPIDVVNINSISYIYMHGKDNFNQFKGFPLIVNEKTENWFNSFFLDSNYTFNKKRIVIKGDLHQFAYSKAKTFDYISMPSVYGSSQWIVANFGKTRWGIAYSEVDVDNNVVTGLVSD